MYVLIKVITPKSKHVYWVHKINRGLFLLWSAFSGFRYSIKGLDKINKGQTYIIICNHSNIADMAASAYGIQIPCKPLVKKELLSIPLLGQLFSMASVPVDRASDTGRKKSMELMREELKMGNSLVIFPEGTRNRTDLPLKDFHNGAFILSKETGIPILPVVFTNIRKISKPNSLLFRPWRIEINHLQPIFPDNNSAQDVEAFKKICHQEMWNFLVDNDLQFKGLDKH